LLRAVGLIVVAGKLRSVETMTIGISAAERVAVFRVARLAAEVDERQDDRDRQLLKRFTAQAAPADPGGGWDLAAVVGGIASPEARRLAYDVAVGACSADGLRGDEETRFLARLGAALGLAQPAVASVAANADALATVPLSALSSPGGPAADDSVPEIADLDRLVLKAAVVNGALGLLPDSASAMAVIPLQLKLVYRIGRAYGFEPNRAQARHLLVAMGAGLVAQYLEHVARRLTAGRRFTSPDEAAKAAAQEGALLAFAKTYAIGEAARRHYASAAGPAPTPLVEAYVEALALGQELYAGSVEQIEAQAREFDGRRLLQFVRSQ
jgi:uncharacterized protein (DUF697 family)